MATENTRSGKQPQQAPPPRRKKRRKISRGRITIIALVAVLLVAAIILMVLLGRFVYQQLFGSSVEIPSVDLHPFKHTDAQYQDKMEYYVLGILGDEEDPCMQTLALVCHDKKAGKLSVLQVPRDLYIDDASLWGDVHRAGEVFANPRPYDWCEVCKHRLYAVQMTEDGRHKTCGMPAATRTGSATLSLMDVFNDHFGMPVDHFFLLPQQAFIKLVDLMEGIDIELEAALKVDDLTYNKGVQTVDGQAALVYMTQRTQGVQGDINMMERQRKVLAAVLQKFLAQTETDYRETTLLPIQKGSTPIRSDFEDKEDLLALVLSLRGISMENISVSLLPGTVVNHQAQQYYSADRDALTVLLNAQFNPAGPQVTVSDVRLPELTDATGTEPNTKTLAEYLPRKAA